MIVSVNWLKKFTDIDGSVEELATLIGARLVEIEEIIDLGERYKDIIVAKVVRAEKHPDADKLTVVELDDGGKADVERLENGHVRVVCGAPNVREGLMVAWLPPGVTVPSSINDAEPFVLDARKLRGVVSNGMLASGSELGLSDDHNGILEIDLPAAPGDSLAELYELDDYLLDIENKSLTHRPDCFGLIGFAREVAAIQGKQFTTPDWLTELAPVLGEKASEELPTPSVTITDPELCSRYQAVVVTDVDATRRLPILQQSYLSRLGMRPIDAMVDVTNYLMLLTGQPLHAFDYDKFIAAGHADKAEVTVREGREGEKLGLLDGREIELSHDDIVICSGDTPVALAGAMGGNTTEVSNTTQRILLESATFDLYRLRTTQMRHGIFSEAITRFTKGQPAAQTAPVLGEAVRLFTEHADGLPASDIADEYPGRQQNQPIIVSVGKVNNVLGSTLTAEEAARPLQHGECTVHIEQDDLRVTAPYWRADIHISEDVIEEIGRIGGFDKITPTLPGRDFTAVAPRLFDTFRNQLRERLVRAGANELYTYTFVHKNMLAKAGQDPANAYRITNALSPDLQYYRLNLTPSLLDKVHLNIRQRFGYFALFEANKVHSKQLDQDDSVAAELECIALTIAADQKIAGQLGTAFYQAKKLLNYMITGTGLTLTYRSLDAVSSDDMANTPLQDMAAPFEPKRSAVVYAGDNVVGVVGEYKAPIARNFKLPDYAAGFEVHARALLMSLPQKPQLYAMNSRFPGTEQDICIQVSPETTYQQVVDVAQKALVDEVIEWHVTPVDIYQPEDEAYKNVTLRVSLIDHTKTITTDEASIKMAYIAEAAREKLAAKIV